MRGRLLVTGANGGIGQAATIAAARAGWDVTASVRNADNADDFRQLLEDEKLDVRVTALDVADAERCAEVVDDVRPTALLNNAGFGSAGAIEEIDDEAARRQLEVMTIAPMRLARLALPHMRANGGGHIVNVSSLGGRTSSALTGWYTASKHALEALSDALRMEVARDNIKVVLVEPGGVNTGILEKTTASMSTHDNSPFADAYQRAHKLTELSQRFQGNPNKVADKIVDILERQNPKARYVVGLDARLLILGGNVFPLAVRDRFKRKLLGI